MILELLVMISVMHVEREDTLLEIADMTEEREAQGEDVREAGVVAEAEVLEKGAEVEVQKKSTRRTSKSKSRSPDRKRKDSKSRSPSPKKDGEKKNGGSRSRSRSRSKERKRERSSSPAGGKTSPDKERASSPNKSPKPQED